MLVRVLDASRATPSPNSIHYAVEFARFDGVSDSGGVGRRIQQTLLTRRSPSDHRYATLELSIEQIDERRYHLTDLLDDFDGANDPDEIIFIAGQLIHQAGGLALASQRRWRGTGK